MSGQLLNKRLETGFVRYCHGDLHLNNIVRFEGQPVLFDCIAFNLELASTDILYDIAFLIMDLHYYGQPEWANRLVSDVAATPMASQLLFRLPAAKCPLFCPRNLQFSPLLRVVIVDR